MDYLASQVLVFIKAHPEWAAFVIGLVAFGESFVFLSLAISGHRHPYRVWSADRGRYPQSNFALELYGAVLGDAISFGLGQKFGPLLSDIWPFRRHPERVESGINFFERYGASSVFVGHSLVPYAPWFH